MGGPVRIPAVFITKVLTRRGWDKKRSNCALVIFPIAGNDEVYDFLRQESCSRGKEDTCILRYVPELRRQLLDHFQFDIVDTDNDNITVKGNFDQVFVSLQKILQAQIVFTIDPN